MPSVLIVDDDIQLGRVIAQALRRRGHDVTTVDTAAAALRACAGHAPACVVVDRDLGPGDGAVLVDELQQLHPSRCILISGADATGAADALGVPFVAKGSGFLIRLNNTIERLCNGTSPSLTDVP
jgi:ActR/RegA family two-component response regulator